MTVIKKNALLQSLSLLSRVCKLSLLHLFILFLLSLQVELFLLPMLAIPTLAPGLVSGRKEGKKTKRREREGRTGRNKGREKERALSVLSLMHGRAL